MLIPHRRKDAQFGEAWLATDDLQNTLVFIRAQSMAGNQVGRDGRLLHGAFLPRVALACLYDMDWRGERGDWLRVMVVHDGCSHGLDPIIAVAKPNTITGR